MMMVSAAECCEILVGISRRMVKLLELALSMLRVVTFDTVNSCAVGEALVVIAYCVL